MARPPKPTAVKREQGTLRKHRERGKAPEPPAEVQLPAPPQDLEQAALKAWNEFGGWLVEAQFLARLDLPALWLLCDLFAEVVRLRADAAGVVAATGSLVVERDMGEAGVMLYTHPIAHQLRAARRELLVALREFGMTPSSRVRVRGAGGGTRPSRQDPRAEFRPSLSVLDAAAEGA
jgi:P27 family predicted phage terminase small subunit